MQHVLEGCDVLTMLGVARPVQKLTALLGLAVGGLLCSGCARRVVVLSDPPGAMVRTTDEVLGPTPYERRLWWSPFGKEEVIVGMLGHRRVRLDLRDNLGWFRGETVHEVILVPEHGPSGTWLPEDAED